MQLDLVKTVSPWQVAEFVRIWPIIAIPYSCPNSYEFGYGQKTFLNFVSNHA